MKIFLNCLFLFHLISSSCGGSIKVLLTRGSNSNQHIISSINEFNADLFSTHTSEFLSEISIGTPPQLFKTTLDMESTNSWVPSSKCGFLNIPCKYHNKYESDNSTTYQKDGSKFMVEHKIGSVSGFLSKDKLCVGSKCIEQQIFGEATTESLVPFREAIYDGVLGMGLTKDSNSLLNNLVDQNLIDRPLFSIWLNKESVSRHDNGQLILGGIESSYYSGNISYIPLNSDSTWSTKMNSISIRGKHRGCGYPTSPGCNVTLDAGSRFIYGPFWEIKTINRWLGATQIVAAYGYYEVYCNSIFSLPTIDFIFDDQVFKLKPQDYIVETSILGKKVCLSGFVGLAKEKKSHWYLGSNFLSAFYSIYDVENKKIGLATSSRGNI